MISIGFSCLKIQIYSERMEPSENFPVRGSMFEIHYFSHHKFEVENGI